MTSTNQPLVQISHLTKTYGSLTALNDISLDLPAGRIIGLLGPNGSGKTTLIKILTGMITTYQGSVSIAGSPVGPKTKAMVSYLPDRPYFADYMRVQDAVALFADFYEDFDRVKANEILTRLALPAKTKVLSLSKGNIEKLQLGLTMARNARLYVLDEPIGGVDPAVRDFILDTILHCYNETGTILLSTHLISDVERIFDTILFLKQGSIVLNDDIDAIRQQHGCSIDQLFREMFKY